MSKQNPAMILTPTELVEPINFDVELVPPTELVEPLNFDNQITLISPEATDDQKTK